MKAANELTVFTKTGILFVLPTLLALLTVPVAARTIYVDGSAAGAGDGSSWADAYADLQAGLSAARGGDEVWVAAGTYLPTVERGGTGERYRAFQLAIGVEVYGGFVGTETSRDERRWRAHETVLSGDINGDDIDSLDSYDLSREDNCYHVLYHSEEAVLDETAVLDGFTITGGNANGGLAWGSSGVEFDLHSPELQGGGMYNAASSPTVSNCVFRGNTAFVDGGGMFNVASDPIVSNCIFQDNSALEDGGGMRNDLGSSPTVVNCIFADNCARYGGGMANDDGSDPAVINCTFVGNTDRQFFAGAMTSDAGAGGGLENSDGSSPWVPETMPPCW
jgi:hypothetical protein